MAVIPRHIYREEIASASASTQKSIHLAAGTCLLPVPFISEIPSDIPKRFGGKDLTMKDIIKLRYR